MRLCARVKLSVRYDVVVVVCGRDRRPVLLSKRRRVFVLLVGM